MTWPATTRYGLEPAAGGLGLVQDFLNTVSTGIPAEPDLLADVSAAQRWVDQAVAEWSEATGLPQPEIALDEGALAELRALREELLSQAASAAEEPSAPSPVPVVHSATAALQLGEDGTVRLEPRGTGWRRLASILLATVFEAHLADTRRRLKSCRNPRCRAAFYDRSRNNSGVWHDVKTCGNAANLRAYRARRRAQSA